MDKSTILMIVGAIWLIGMAVFLKDYLLGERQVKRKRGRPTVTPRVGYGADDNE